MLGTAGGSDWVGEAATVTLGVLVADARAVETVNISTALLGWSGFAATKGNIGVFDESV